MFPQWLFCRAMVFFLAMPVAMTIVAATPSAIEAQQNVDVVYLKDGSILRGAIIEHTGESILIEMKDRSRQRVSMERIERITRESATGGSSTGAPTTSEANPPRDSQVDRSPASAVGPANGAPVALARSWRNPTVAWALSFAIPGGGQVYNGQWGKAIPMFVMHLVGITGIVVADSCVEYYDSYSGTYSGCDDAYTAGGLGIVLVLASSIWSQVDAPIAAGSINRAGGRTASLEVGPRVIALRSAPTPAHRGIVRTSPRIPQLGVSLVTMRF